MIDRHSFPTPDGSSIDSSRIIRADYKDPDYASLCLAAQARWRAGTGVWEGLGANGRYTESGLVLVVDKKDGGIASETSLGGGGEYVQKSYENMQRLLIQEAGMSKEEVATKVVQLKGLEEISSVCGSGGGSGTQGYVNWLSGWADAEKAMRFVRRRCEARGDIDFRVGEVVGLLESEGGDVEGVELKDGIQLRAELTVLATGAWTPGLIDLEGRAVSTGQVMGYVRCTEEEEARWNGIPVLLNLSSGMAHTSAPGCWLVASTYNDAPILTMLPPRAGLFLLPPRNGICKVARHAIGYLNTQSVTLATNSRRSVQVQRSVPITALKTSSAPCIPAEGEADLRRGLQEMLPALGDRPFESTRICWYTDTPTGDFIVDHVPGKKGLFIATGGSGHAFKFLPMLGDVIVGILTGEAAGVWKEKWRWRETLNVVGGVVTKDGSRAGARQTELSELYEEEGMMTKVRAKL